MIIPIEIKENFKNQLFQDTLKKLEDHIPMRISELGDILFEDHQGNWLHICNLTDEQHVAIGIVSKKASDPYPEGGAFTRDKNYGPVLAHEARVIFGL